MAFFRKLLQQKHNCVNSIQFMRPLYFIANVLTLTPKFDSRLSDSSLAYPLIFITFLVFFSMWILFRNYALPDDGTGKHSVKIMDILNYIAMILSNVFGTCGVRIINEKRIKLFLRSCAKLDRDLKYAKPDTSARFAGSYAELAIFNIFFLAYTITIFFRDSEDGLEIAMDFYEKIQQYHNLILALIVYYLGLYINEKFKMINQNLMIYICDKYQTLATDGDDTFQSDLALHEISFNSLHCIKMFTTLSNLVRDFNIIFGWQILITAFNSIIGIIYILNVALLSAIAGMFQTNLRALIVECVFYFIQIVVMGLAIVHSCGMAFAEAQETATVCYKCLEVLPHKERKYEKELRKELVRLMHQSMYSCPVFSGAGFFTVDKQMLFNMLGAITTYLIVLIQFNDFKE